MSQLLGQSLMNVIPQHSVLHPTARYLPAGLLYVFTVDNKVIYILTIRIFGVLAEPAAEVIMLSLLLLATAFRGVVLPQTLE